MNLICLPLTQLDIILGMDWLSSIHVWLNCSDKTLIYNFNVSPTPKDSRFLSANQIMVHLKEGAQGYMLLPYMELQGEQNLLKQPVVQEYPEVFPRDVPGLPCT